MTRAFLVLSGLLLLAGCNNPPVTPPDAPLPDAPAIEPSFLFGACATDAECEHLAEGAICRTSESGPAGGYCTVPCTDRTPCDARGSYHHCLPLEGETGNFCIPRCRNGVDCGRPGWTCDPTAGPTGDDGVCITVCQTDAECGDGAVCNVEAGTCEAPPVDTNGAPHGSPCAGPTDCQSGQCVTEGTRTAPSGWVGGMCVGPCRLPDGFNTTNFFSGDALPRGGCVEGAVCIAGSQYGEGDLGSCYDECVETTDCRPGFGCLRTLAGHMFTNGICVPQDCRGGTCPTGYTCTVVTQTDGSQVGRCAP